MGGCQRPRENRTADDRAPPAPQRSRLLRILLVTHNFPRHADDMAGAFLLALARGQQALGHGVRVVAPHAPGLAERESVGGVEVVRYRYGDDGSETLAYAGTMHEQALRSWPARWRLIQFLRAGRRALRQECAAYKPDLLHVHWWVPGGFTYWPGGRQDIPVVLTSHGTDLFLLDRFPLARTLAGPIFRAASQVTVISSPLVERVTRLGIPADRITILPMPVSAERFTAPLRPERDAGKLLFVGRLIERKGAEYAVRALARLRSQGRAVRLTIIGDGADRLKLVALVDELGLRDAVDFAGALPHDDVAAHYRSASLLLMPAITDWKGEQEGFGMVLVEAMASELPIVATRCGGIPDVVTDGATGLLVPEQDPGALATAAARLLDDPALSARFAAAARADLDRRFTPAGLAAGFDTVYRRAVTEPARSAGHPWIRRALQVAGLAAATWYLVHSAVTHRTELSAVPLVLDPVPLLAASGITVLTWFLLVRTWAASLQWWGASLPFGTAVRIWFVTNLSRFVPGAVWQFAHVSAEALSARISPVAATGAILFQQLVLLGTGLALTASLAPVLPVSVTGTANPIVTLGLASLAVVAVIIFLPAAAPTLERWTTRLFRRELKWPAPTHRAMTAYVGTLVLPWIAYGVAFWLFGRALLGETAPALLPAAAAFIGSYVAGILAVFAPGGLGVREAALVLLLSPISGPAPALLLAVMSRLWLVALEIFTALGVLVWHRRAVSSPE